ncbi:MAG TPA: hypothetical protein VNT30_20255 [Stellaceae bacterium]|nr:hypothetical protein [Stellaceae bacterium]
MSKYGPNDHPDDAQLVAYLDGELDAPARARVRSALADDAVAARLAELSGTNLPFRQAFEPLLKAAPTERLNTMLDALLTSPGQPGTKQARRLGWERRRFLAASVALVAAGALSDRLLIAFGRPAEEPDHWRAVVAQYLSLYTAETLADIPPDTELRAKELALVNARIGLGLTPQGVDVPGALLKRSQMLLYDSEPLAEITYLDPRSGPMALCIVRSNAPANPVRTEQRRGMNVAYWSGAGHAFMLIGRRPVHDIAAAAQAIADRLSAATG